MAAKDYELTISALGGKPYICKITKGKDVMGDDRIEVPKSVFIGAMVEWLRHQCDTSGSDTVSMTANGVVVAEFTLKSI